MSTTAVVTDSTSCLTARDAAALGIGVVPLHVTLGDWSAVDTEIDPEDFARRLRAADARPTTSQPAPGDFVRAFTDAAAGGAERVLCITCSTTLSGTHGSARLAAGLSPVPVDVLDSGTISGGLRLVVTELSQALAGGASHEDALALAAGLRGRVWSTWSADTTALLAAGGRARTALPEGVAVLALEGEVVPLGSARSVEESVRLQAERVRAAARRSPTRVTVGHGDVPDLADALADALEGAPGIVAVDRYVVAASVGAHTGPGSFGANYVTGAP